MAKKVNKKGIYKRAEDAIRKKNYPLAVYNYMQVVKSDPEDFEAYELLRKTQMKNANENGTSGLKAMIAKLKATVFGMLGKTDQAYAALEDAITANPENVALLQQFASFASDKLENDKLAAWQLQWIVDHLDEDEGILTELAELYTEIGQVHEAIGCYDKVLASNPKADVKGKLKDLQARMTSEVYSQGVEKGSRGIQQDDEEAEILELLAGKLKTDDQRLKVINYKLEHDAVDRPHDHRIYITIGDVALGMDDWKEGYKRAKEYFAKAYEINETDSVVKDKMADVEIRDLQVKERVLKAKVKKDPEDKELRKKLKAMMKKRADFEVKEYERRVKDQPLKAIFHYKLGELYFKSGNWEGAISELQDASKDPKYQVAALTMLGRAFIEDGQYDLAIRQLEAAMAGQEIFEKIREPKYFLSQALEKMGDEGDEDAMKQALEITTDLYQNDIRFMDVKERLPVLQKKVKAMKAGA